MNVQIKRQTLCLLYFCFSIFSPTSLNSPRTQSEWLSVIGILIDALSLCQQDGTYIIIWSIYHNLSQLS